MVDVDFLQYGIKIFVITSFKDTCYIEILPSIQKSERGKFLLLLKIHSTLIIIYLFSSCSSTALQTFNTSIASFFSWKAILRSAFLLQLSFWAFGQRFITTQYILKEVLSRSKFPNASHILFKLKTDYFVACPKPSQNHDFIESTHL